MDQNKIDELLNGNGCPPKIGDDTYTTTHDDNDGDPYTGLLNIIVDRFGDVHLSMVGRYLRFRTFSGGGQFLKIRNALLILAEAIRQEGKIK